MPPSSLPFVTSDYAAKLYFRVARTITGHPRSRMACDTPCDLHRGHSHFAALFGAATASFGAGLAVLVLELRTLGPAGVAQVGTEPANLAGVAAASGHPLRSKHTNVRTVPEQLNAVGPSAYIRFMEAGGSTMLAFNCTLLTRLDTGLILFVH